MKYLPATVLLLVFSVFAKAQDFDQGFHFGLEIRPVFLFLPGHIEYVSVTDQVQSGGRTLTYTYNIFEDRMTVLGAGVVAPQAGWGRHTFRLGPVLNYPLYPNPNDSDYAVAPERKLLVSWLGEYQYDFSRRWALSGGYATYRYNLLTAIPPGTDNRYLVAKNTIRSLYAGPRFKAGPLVLSATIGSLSEKVRASDRLQAIGFGKPRFLLTFGAGFSFSWRRN